MKAIFVNGSPRKDFNTYKLLAEAMRGAKEAGAEVELIQLKDYQVQGCQSCFACKVKGSKTQGVCALRDDLRPVLEKFMDADALVIGSPIYFGNLTAGTLALIERILFPVLNYKKPVDGKAIRTLPKEKKVALILDMNVPYEMTEKIGYHPKFEEVAGKLGNFLSDGTCQTLWSCNTYQFDDYDKYDVNMFDMESKEKALKEQFPKDLEAAYELGKALI